MKDNDYVKAAALSAQLVELQNKRQDEQIARQQQELCGDVQQVKAFYNHVVAIFCFDVMFYLYRLSLSSICRWSLKL